MMMSVSFFKKIRHRLELLGVRILKALPLLMPYRCSVKAGGFLGILAFDIFRIRRSVTLSNLERAFGDGYNPKERIRIGRRSYVNFAKSMVEFASLGRLTRERLISMVRINGRGEVDEVLSRGRGFIGVTGHFGSWEILGAGSVAHGLPIDFLVGEQSNRLVDDLMNDLRSSAGIGIIGRGAAARGIFKSLAANRIVAMLSDQDARKAGIFVDFFSTPSSTYPGAAQFAYRSGCPIIFCYIVRCRDESHEAIFLPPIEPDVEADKESEIARLTAAHAKMLEECIRRHPDHYFWAHRRWKTKPPARADR
jgi:KDO2-lipid IV(A) lauroyltransferase